MISDIFSSFDPAINNISSIFSGTILWFLRSSLLLILSTSFWLSNSRYIIIITSCLSIINSQVSRTLGTNIKRISSLISPLFILIISVNFIGLLPYVFRSTRHLLFSIRFGTVLWLRIIISAIQYSPTTFLANLLPGGAPLWLNPFLVLIETTRIIARPITLSLRLAANIRAGHVVLTLLGAYTITTLLSSPIRFIFLFPTEVIYTLFEVGICLIQAYIFCLLLSLYSDDHPTK